MKKLIKILFVLMICLAFNKTVYGMDAGIRASSTSVDLNKSVTITASVSDVASWNLSMSASGGSLSGTTSSADVADDGISTSKQVMSATFKASTEGTYTITLKGQIVDGNINSSSVQKSVTITVKAPEVIPSTPETPKTSQPAKTQTNTKSSNANLSNLITSPVDFSGFKASKTSGYSITVGNDVDTVKVTAKTQHSKATYKVSGNTNLKEGDNTISVVVTAEDGTKKTYKVNVHKLGEAESEVPTQTDEILETISEEIVEIEEVKLGLEKLEIENMALEPGFNSEVYEYNLKLLEDVSKLNINAVAYSENLDVQILGNENLAYGENTIKVIVTDKESDKSVTYTIIVDKIKNNEEKSNENIEKLQKEVKTRNIVICILGIIVLVETAILVKIITHKKKGHTLKIY